MRWMGKHCNVWIIQTFSITLIVIIRSLGLVAGPVCGGLLAAQYHFRIVPLVSTALFAVDIIVILFGLPEPSIHRPQQTKRPLLGLWRAIHSRRIAHIMSMQLLAAIAQATLNSAMLLEMQARFGATAADGGMLIAGLGIVSAVIQGPVVSVLTRLVSLRSSVLLGAVIGCGGHVLSACSTTEMSYMLGLGIVAAGQSVISTCLTTFITALSKHGAVGSYLGMSGSISSFAQAIFPIIGGLLVQTGTRAFNIFCAAIFAVFILVALPLTEQHH